MGEGRWFSCALRPRAGGTGGAGWAGLPSHTPSRLSASSPSDLPADSGRHPRPAEPRGGRQTHVRAGGGEQGGGWGLGCPVSRATARPILVPTPFLALDKGGGGGWAGHGRRGGVRETEAHCPASGALLVLDTHTRTHTRTLRGAGPTSWDLRPPRGRIPLHPCPLWAGHPGPPWVPTPGPELEAPWSRPGLAGREATLWSWPLGASRGCSPAFPRLSGAPAPRGPLPTSVPPSGC